MKTTHIVTYKNGYRQNLSVQPSETLEQAVAKIANLANVKSIISISMPSSLLGTLVELGALARQTDESREVYTVIGHESMNVNLTRQLTVFPVDASGGWFGVYVDGERWGSFPHHQEARAVDMLFALTFESTAGYAEQYVRDLLSGKVNHNQNPA